MSVGRVLPLKEPQFDELDVALGQAIRAKRASKNISQGKLAEALGVSFQQVQKYERGANRVSFSTLVRTAQALGCRVQDLVADIDKGMPTDDPDARVRELLAEQGAFVLLETFASIRSARLRRAVIDLARSLSVPG